MLGKILLAVYVLSASFALITLKIGTQHKLPIYYVDNQLQFSINKYVILGFALYGFSFFSYMYLIAKNDLGYIIPFAASLVYIILFTASHIIFKEVFTTVKLIGIFLIMVGAILINLKR